MDPGLFKQGSFDLWNVWISYEEERPCMIFIPGDIIISLINEDIFSYKI